MARSFLEGNKNTFLCLQERELFSMAAISTTEDCPCLRYIPTNTNMRRKGQKHGHQDHTTLTSSCVNHVVMNPLICNDYVCGLFSGEQDSRVVDSYWDFQI